MIRNKRRKGYRSSGNFQKSEYDDGGLFDKVKNKYNTLIKEYNKYDDEGYTIPSTDNRLLDSLVQGYTIKGGFGGEDFTVYDQEGKKDKLRTNILNTYENVTSLKSKISPHLPHNIVKNLFIVIFLRHVVPY